MARSYHLEVLEATSAEELTTKYEAWRNSRTQYDASRGYKANMEIWSRKFTHTVVPSGAVCKHFFCYAIEYDENN